MKRYTVEITDAALADMDEIYGYIRNVLQAPSTAAALYDEIADEILSLETMPERNPIPSVPFFRETGLRRMLVNGYSVFYLVKGDRVIITDVLYSASDIPSRLADRHEEPFDQ